MAVEFSKVDHPDYLRLVGIGVKYDLTTEIDVDPGFTFHGDAGIRSTEPLAEMRFGDDQATFHIKRGFFFLKDYQQEKILIYGHVNGVRTCEYMDYKDPSNIILEFPEDTQKEYVDNIVALWTRASKVLI